MKGGIIADTNVFVSNVNNGVTLSIWCLHIDQSASNIEVHGGRALPRKRIKILKVTVQHVKIITDSDTIQPFICADGVLKISKLLFLKENGIIFGF